MIRWFLKFALAVSLAFTPHAVVAQMAVPVQRAAAPAFDNWQAGFRGKALTAGIPASVFDAAFANVRYNTNTATQYDNQSEFVRPIWAYLDDAVSDRRVMTGRQKAQALGGDLQRISRKYGVGANTLLAIWGMETSFGGFRGNTYTIEALANAAHDGRRRDFAEAELIAALHILASGIVTPERMLGGWSGAMGDTQFMPSTYLRYGVDGNGDGVRDFWGRDPLDALASSANYLHALGWKAGQPWGQEVTLPNGFDYALIGEHDTQSARFWNERGVRLVSGGKLANHGATALLAPAGARGPVFAIYPNFQVIRQYNMSVSYSLAVGHLSDRIGGAAGFRAVWPRGDQALTRAQVLDIQQRLMARGLDTGGADGRIGPKTVEAIQAWQVSQGLRADGYATVSVWQALR